MKPALEKIVLEVSGAETILAMETIETLWSGYGEIVRVGLTGADPGSVIVKYIAPPDEMSHPRGWNSQRSHQRKLDSYEVELHWYQHWSKRCDSACRVPRCLHATSMAAHQHLIILEDLDRAGYPRRRSELLPHEVSACLAWLANFHATFMNETPVGLWPIGTYWHLDTRPDELAAMDDTALKHAASEIDRMLNRARYRTLVHGDAKVANFCFSEDGQQVAAVDFQYVGGGCGMKDLAYFLGSCLTEKECEQYQDDLLDEYFDALQKALTCQRKELDFQALEREWRRLYPVAWADFQRFLLGWNPGHWKINGYSQRQVQKVLENLSATDHQ